MNKQADRVAKAMPFEVPTEAALASGVVYNVWKRPGAIRCFVPPPRLFPAREGRRTAAARCRRRGGKGKTKSAAEGAFEGAFAALPLTNPFVLPLRPFRLTPGLQVDPEILSSIPPWQTTLTKAASA